MRSETKRVTILLSPQVHVRLAEKAKEEGMPLAVWVRTRVLKFDRRLTTRTEEVEHRRDGQRKRYASPS
jgi:hypothetical protein